LGYGGFKSPSEISDAEVAGEVVFFILILFLKTRAFAELYRRKRDTCQRFFNFGEFLANLWRVTVENRRANREDCGVGHTHEVTAGFLEPL
jgi:hypothetical protein